MTNRLPSPPNGFAAGSAGTRRRGVSELLIAIALRVFLRIYLAVVWTLRATLPEPVAVDGEAVDVLLTLQFYAAGWPVALLGPLAMSPRCRRLRIVTTAGVPNLAGVEVIQPPSWLRLIVGSTVARLVTFAAVAVKSRPQFVGGVHLLFNGLLAALVARLAGARALYVCVGGPNEISEGGLLSENRAFGRIGIPDPAIEELLLRAVSHFDHIVTMGTRAAAFFTDRGIRCPVDVIPSGVSADAFIPSDTRRDVDVVLVSRLVPVKRLDLFVRAIARVRETRPDVRAVIVGTGPERAPAEDLARDLGLAANLSFIGHAPEVATWLARSRVFLLTSDTEGVSISLIEAMLAGAVPVVSSVGDLGDVVEHAVSGMLVHDRTPEGFAQPIIDLMTCDDRWSAMSAAARIAATRFTPAAITPRWSAVLEGSVRRSQRAALADVK